MTQPAEVSSVFDTFTTWAKAQKIFVCDGIAPGKIGKEGEGSGIFARRTITVCDASLLCFAFYTFRLIEIVWLLVVVYFLGCLVESLSVLEDSPKF